MRIEQIQNLISQFGKGKISYCEMWARINKIIKQSKQRKHNKSRNTKTPIKHHKNQLMPKVYC